MYHIQLTLFSAPVTSAASTAFHSVFATSPTIPRVIPACSCHRQSAWRLFVTHFESFRAVVCPHRLSFEVCHLSIAPSTPPTSKITLPCGTQPPPPHELQVFSSSQFQFKYSSGFKSFFARACRLLFDRESNRHLNSRSPLHSVKFTASLFQSLGLVSTRIMS